MDTISKKRTKQKDESRYRVFSKIHVQLVLPFFFDGVAARNDSPPDFIALILDSQQTLELQLHKTTRASSEVGENSNPKN